MSRGRKERRCGLLLAVIPLISGCFSTHLPPLPSSTDLKRLVGACPARVSLRVSSELSPGSRGYQFLAIVLPIARVYADSVLEAVSSGLTTRAGLAGYGLLSSGAKTLVHPRLNVSIRDLSVRGYDLLVVRRPSAAITLRATLDMGDGRTKLCEATGSHSEFSTFAFERELNHALELAVDEASHKITECLGWISGAQVSRGHGEESVS